MNIITLTTDWGIQDNYSAIFRAHLLREDASVQIVDITHQVSANHIREAAFLLKTSYHYFPENSIHIIDINNILNHNKPRHDAACRMGETAINTLPFLDYVAFRHNNHYFLCENNGIISFLCTKFDIEEVVKLPAEGDYGHFATFKAIPYYVKAAARLAKGVPLAEIGEKYDINRIETIPNTPPIVSQSDENDMIAFNALHVDNYGNIITNLHKDLFEKIANGRTRFDFYHTALGVAKRQKISLSYNDISKSSLLFLFGHHRYLEILTKHAPLDKLLLGHNAAPNMLDWMFTVYFRKEEIND
jgi:S-adenosylmethionine hydrolase